MDEQEIPKTHVSEIKLNELLVRLGYDWDTDENLWMPPEEPLSQKEAVEILRLYEEGR